MKRRFSSRLLGALLAPWFAFVVAEPVSMHACAMHSGHDGPSSSAPIVAGAHAEHGSTHANAHVKAHEAVQPAQTETPAPSNQHPCNCMGMGCQPAAVPLPSAQFSLIAVAEHRVALKVVPTAADNQPASQREHDRPFAIGPPTLRS